MKKVNEETLLGIGKIFVKANNSEHSKSNIENHIVGSIDEKIKKEKEKSTSKIDIKVNKELNNDIQHNMKYDENRHMNVKDDLTSIEEIESENKFEKEVNKKKENLFNDLNLEYINSLKEQIEYLKKQIDVKDEQLDKKDELIRNFQILMNNDKERIVLLESMAFKKDEENIKESNISEENISEKAERNDFKTGKDVKSKKKFFNIFKRK